MRTIDCGNPVNRNHPLTRGLVSWYLCVPGLMGGSKWHNLMALPSDLSTGNHGTLTNFAPSQAIGFRGTNRLGGFGELKCDGTDDYVAAPWTGTNFNRTDAFAYSLWLRFTTTSADYRTLITKRTSGGRHPGEIVILPNSGMSGNESKLQADSYNGSGGPSVTHGTLLNDGVWHQVAYVHHANSTFDLYVDGVLSGTSTSESGTTSSGEDFRIGSDVALSREFDGQMDDVRIFNRDPSGTEIRASHINALSGYPGLLNRVQSLMLAKNVAAAKRRRRFMVVSA